MTKKLFYREVIRDLLVDIGNLDRMRGPTEMICFWFDDNYWPSRPDMVPRSRSFREWKSCFSEAQLNDFERFHDAFSGVVNQLSVDPKDFFKDPNWRHLSVLASEIRPRFDDKE